MSMKDSRLKPKTTAPSASGSNNPPGSSGPRWRIRCKARGIAPSASAAAASGSCAPPGPAGAATKASSPHTAPQYAALTPPTQLAIRPYFALRVGFGAVGPAAHVVPQRDGVADGDPFGAD